MDFFCCNNGAQSAIVSPGLLFCIVGLSVDKNRIGSAQPPRFHVLGVRKGEKIIEWAEITRRKKKIV